MATPSTAREAFVPGSRVTLSPTRDGQLSGLTFAAKDLLDVAGQKKTSGNPDWLRTHPAARTNAEVIDRLLSTGARLAGSTICDELAFSLEGDNVHYGIPLNPRCPDRLPGGSSSGSASAVASGSVDFALGTDTGGSVRVPSSFCGIFGIRPTHGRVSVAGVTPLGPSYDTVGWMARDGATLARVGTALLGEEAKSGPTDFAIVEDAFELLSPSVRHAFERPLRTLFDRARTVRLFDSRPDDWAETARILVESEAWSAHGRWYQEVHPKLGPDIAFRFEEASRVTPEEVARARRLREEFAGRVGNLLKPRHALVVPSAPSDALPRDRAHREAAPSFRRTAIAIGSIAGHCRLPQVSLPVAVIDGHPLGVGVIGPPGYDVALLAFAASPAVRALTV